MTETNTPAPTEPIEQTAEPISKWAVAGAILVLVIVGAAIAGLVYIKQSHNRQNLADAKAVADKAIVAIQKRDGAAARALGTKEFRSMYTDEQLAKQFKSVEVATSQPPKFDSDGMTTLKSRPAVYDIYAYTRLKVPFYVRTTVVKENGNWKLANITGNLDKAKITPAQ